MQVRVRGLGSHARRATPRAAGAAPRRDDGDGDGPLADGRTLGCYVSMQLATAGSVWVDEVSLLCTGIVRQPA